MVVIFQCSPVSEFWSKQISAKCSISDHIIFFVQSGPNILTDVALLLLYVFLYIIFSHSSSFIQGTQSCHLVLTVDAFHCADLTDPSFWFQAGPICLAVTKNDFAKDSTGGHILAGWYVSNDDFCLLDTPFY